MIFYCRLLWSFKKLKIIQAIENKNITNRMQLFIYRLFWTSASNWTNIQNKLTVAYFTVNFFDCRIFYSQFATGPKFLTVGFFTVKPQQLSASQHCNWIGIAKSITVTVTDCRFASLSLIVTVKTSQYKN